LFTRQPIYVFVKFRPEQAEEATRSSGKIFLGQDLKVTIKGNIALEIFDFFRFLL